MCVAKAVQSRAQCTTLEAVRTSETKFCTRNIAQVFTTFSFKLFYVQLRYFLALRVLVFVVRSFFERVFRPLRFFFLTNFSLFSHISALNFTQAFNGWSVPLHNEHCGCGFDVLFGSLEPSSVVLVSLTNLLAS